MVKEEVEVLTPQVMMKRIKMSIILEGMAEEIFKGLEINHKSNVTTVLSLGMKC